MPILQAEVERLVVDARQARLEAEETELDASPARWREADCYAALSDSGWSQERIAEACETNRSSVSKFIRCSRKCSVLNRRPTFWTAFAELNSEPMMSSTTPEWGTPQDLFDELDAEFGFETDVCATAELAKCARYFSPDDDGLAQEWTGMCWMNPPYGSAIGDWMCKAYESAQSGATVVCLVPARIETDWFWDYCRHGEVRVLHGRLQFEGATSSAPFPSVVVVMGGKSKVVFWQR